MTIETKLERVEADSPDRCQSGGKDGQCPYKKAPGYEFCPRHFGKSESAQSQKRIRNYRLGRFQARVEEFADNDQVKSLREEVGIARMLLEDIILRCSDDPNGLLLYNSKISELVMKIEKLVASCHKLEQATGMLMDKTMITNLADVFVNIIGKYVKDEEMLTNISNEIIVEILKINGNTEAAEEY